MSKFIVTEEVKQQWGHDRFIHSLPVGTVLTKVEYEVVLQGKKEKLFYFQEEADAQEKYRQGRFNKEL